MRRKTFPALDCPVARARERVGECWSILILRDACRGSARFEQFRKSLGIAPNILTRRLTALVGSGLLERHRYSERPPRDEYVLTESGHEFRIVLCALRAWSRREFVSSGHDDDEIATIPITRRGPSASVRPAACAHGTARPEADGQTGQHHPSAVPQAEFGTAGTRAIDA